MSTATTSQSEITETLLRIARDRYREGPGMAQESVVLREASEAMHADRDVQLQQRILNVWHELFRSGKLVWGYDIDNPGPPFFHFPEWVEHERLPTW